MTYRVGVDVGGTFTDFLLFEEESGASTAHKTPSTPRDPAVGLLRGLGELVLRLDEEQARAAIEELVGRGVESLAISLVMNAYVFPAYLFPPPAARGEAGGGTR